MSEDWAAVAAEVSEGLAEVGVTGYILRRGAEGGETFNPTPGTDVQHQCTVVYARWATNLIDGTMIRATDQKILVSTAGLSIVPQVGDRFWDGVSMNGAEKVTGAVVPPLPKVSPARIDVLYTLNVRY